MSDATYRDQWIEEVFRTSLITDSVRVALLALAPEMDEEGRVSVRREWLADRLARSDRKAGERINAAISAGFIERVARGQKYRPAVYQATTPDALRGTPGVPADISANPGFSGNPGVPAEGSQGDGLQPPENLPQREPRGSSREARVAGFSGNPGVPAEVPPIYKARARAHFNGDRRSTTASAEADDSRRGGVVVALFNEEIEPSLRSHTAERSSAARADARAEPDPFDEFWNAYPRRVGKGAARKAWAKALKKGAHADDIIWGARRYSTDPRRSTSDIRYTAHPATWLNAERWTDDPEPAPLALDARQRATDDLFDSALQRARARDAQEHR